jgi:hypothetical protein
VVFLPLKSVHCVGVRHKSYPRSLAHADNLVKEELVVSIVLENNLLKGQVLFELIHDLRSISELEQVTMHNP